MNNATGQNSLGSRAARGSAWTLSGYAFAQALRLGGNLVLTRLLFEEAFGLMALVQVFMQGLAMFSDLGIGVSLLRSPRGDEPDFFRTAWTLQLIRGFALWLLACAGARPFATFYRMPELAWLIPLAGFSAALSGLDSSKKFRLRRAMRLAHVTILEIVSQLVGIVVMIAWALVEPSVVALVAGGLVSSCFRAVASHVFLPGTRDGLRLEKLAARELVHFGRWIFLSTLFYFLARQLDKLVLGKLVTASALGVYSIGANFAILPAGILTQLTISIALPLYSRVLHERSSLKEAFSRVHQPLLVVAGWMVSGLFVCGPSAIKFLYDPRFHDAGHAARLLSIGVWFSALEGVYAAALLAHGRSQWTAAANAAQTFAIVLLMPAGFAIAGFSGAVIGFSFSSIVMYAVNAIAARRLGFGALRADSHLTLIVALVSALGVFVEHHAEAAQFPAIVIFLLGGTVCTLAWAIPGVRAWRRFRSFS